MKLRILMAVAVCLAVLYAADDLSVRYRIPKSRQPFGSVTIQRLDVISEKNNRSEYVSEAPFNRTCVQSLFPHLGYQPCWYLSRHSQQQVNY